jgi:hypothetical protein
MEQPSCAPVPRESATELRGEAGDQVVTRTLSRAPERSPQRGKASCAPIGKLEVGAARQISASQPPPLSEIVGGRRERSGEARLRRQTPEGRMTRVRRKVSPRSGNVYSHPPRGRVFGFQRSKCRGVHPFGNSLANPLSLFQSPCVVACTSLAAFVGFSSLGRLQVRRQPDPAEVHIAIAHRGFLGGDGCSEQRMRTLLQDARDADQLLVEHTPGEDLRWLAATLTSKHANARRQQRAGGASGGPVE